MTRPPVVHAHSGSEPAPSSRSVPFPGTEVHVPTPPVLPSHPTSNAQVEVAAPELEGRPPSIHLSETVSATVDHPGPPADSLPEPNSPAQPDMPPHPVTTTRTRRMTLDLPSSPIDVLYESDHKLALEGTSPKPCIVPGNALHLIDDDPAAPRSATPPSVIIVGDESEHGGEVDTDMDGDEGDAERSASQPPPSSAARPMPRVRFRSRVRITSGVHRHRHSMSAPGGSTPGSSNSDSPSSSISAPLRYQADENAAWGPIGKRLSQYAAAGGWQRRTQMAQGAADVNGAQTGGARGVRGGSGARGYNERTPLLRPPAGRHAYSESEDEDAGSMGESERAARAAALRREEEVVFGKWPWRIFNRHVSMSPRFTDCASECKVLQWWWWHVEPVLCCCCADDSDYDEF